jgi:hypothetical protein
MPSELQRFGFTGDGDNDRWKASVEKFLVAILTNPHLKVGDTNSQIEFLQAPPPAHKAQAPAPTTEVNSGAFYGLIDDEGTIYLQGGTVTAGDGSHTFPRIQVTNSSGVPLHTSGHHLYIKVTGDCVTADGVLLQGFNLTSATQHNASSVPPNTLPTATEATGKDCYIDLGEFTETTFNPSGIGNFEVSFCPGSFGISRY